MSVVFSAQDNQQQILVDISTLHNEGLPFDADIFYGGGAFWTGVAEHLRPRIRMDLTPVWKPVKGTDQETTDVNLQADARALPFKDNSLESICLDGPFIHAAGKDSIMGQRFGSYPSQLALRQMYWKAMMEVARVITPGGLVVVKCQDIIESGKQCWNGLFFMDTLRTIGIPVIDLFVLVRKGAVIGHNHSQQFHARRNHSYFIVARKETVKLEPHTPKPRSKALSIDTETTS